MDMVIPYWTVARNIDRRIIKDRRYHGMTTMVDACRSGNPQRHQ
jgi:hypothetical protein